MYTCVYMKKKLIPIIATIVLFIDQIIKLIIRKNMNLYNSIKIIKNFFNITYVKNIGAAWSIFSGFQIPLIIFTIIVLIILYYYFVKDKCLKNCEIIIYGILLGGILGNLFDRIFLNGVIDYLDFIILGYDFPIFNFADIAIVISMFSLVFLELRGEKNDSK